MGVTTTVTGRSWPLAMPLTICFVAFFLAPLLILLTVSFFNDSQITQVGLNTWRDFLTDPFYWKVTFDTVKLGFLTVVATLIIGVPLSVLYLKSGPRTQRVIILIVILPLLLSVVVRTFAWIVILSREGVINQALLYLGLVSTPIRLLQTEFGLIISLTQIELPLMLLPLISVMSRIDLSMLDASAALGASKWRTFFKVILPLSVPGLIAGCTLVFASATTAFISQSVIGGNRLVYLPLIVWQQSLVVYNWPLAAVASTMLLLSVLLCIVLIGLVGKKGMRYLHV